MLSCESDNHYLASPQFITLALHVLSCLAVPIHLLGFYCILYKTPKAMSSVKLLLLNLHVWSVILDIVLTFFAVPYAIFPAMAGYGLGLIDSPGIFMYLIVTVINTVTISIIIIFENRFYILFAQKTWWARARIPFIVINYILNPLYFLPPQFMIPEQTMARKVILESLPCLPELPANRELFVLSLDNFWPGLTVNICGDGAGIQLSIFVFLNFYNLLKMSNSTRLSERTVQMQKKLAIAVFVQSLSSLIWFSVPIAFVVYLSIFDYHNQFLNNLVFVFVSSHGMCSTIIMICCHKPYREFVLSPVTRLCRKVPVIIVTSSNSSGNILPS